MTEPAPEHTDQQAARPPRRRARLGADFSLDSPTAPLATGRPDEDADAPAQPAEPPPAPAPAGAPQQPPAAAPTQPQAPAPEPETAPQPQQRPAAAPARRSNNTRKGASRNASKRASKGAPVHPEQQATTQASAQATTQAGSVLRTQLMRGKSNPYNDVGQSGIRLPMFLRDAVRSKVALSQGEWNTQRLVSEAVEWFLVEALGEDELVEEAWTMHGGPPGLREEHRPR